MSIVLGKTDRGHRVRKREEQEHLSTESAHSLPVLDADEERGICPVFRCAACLAAINVGKSPPHRSGPERTFDRPIWHRPLQIASHRCAPDPGSSPSARVGRAGRCLGSCWGSSWNLPCERSKSLDHDGRSQGVACGQASEAQRRGRKSVSAAVVGILATRCSVTIGPAW